jgi:hypothetical protein
VVALEIEKYLAKEAAERQRAGAELTHKKLGRKYDEKMLREIFPEASCDSPEDRRPRSQAATLIGTNSHYVSDAKRIVRELPEVLELVRRGELTIPQPLHLLLKETVVPVLPQRITKNGHLTVFRNQANCILADPQLLPDLQSTGMLLQKSVI